MIDGLLVVDKPAGITSHDVVSSVRWLSRQKRVGHAGTLDPDATGVLVVGLGRATKLLTYIVGDSKTYRAMIRLGVRTVTEDASGSWIDSVGAVLGVDAVAPSADHGGSQPGVLVCTEQIDRAIAALTGKILQVPSKVSAIKVGGKRAYARLRSGEDVQLAPRPVTIHRFERLSNPQATWLSQPASVPVVDFEVEVDCSSGTYIRALARDLGEALGCGAHLTKLRRTRVGSWTLADAVQLPERIVQTGDSTRPALPKYLSLSQAALRIFPRAILSRLDFAKFQHGGAPQSVLVTGGDRATGAAKACSQPIYAAVSEEAPEIVGGLLLQVKSGSNKSDGADKPNTGEQQEEKIGANKVLCANEFLHSSQALSEKTDSKADTDDECHEGFEPVGERSQWKVLTVFA